MTRATVRCAALVLTLSGCAGASTDPHTGGLIGGINGLATGAYDKRIADKQADVADLETAGLALSSRVESAKDRLANLEQALATHRVKLAKMKAEIAEVDKVLAAGASSSVVQMGMLAGIKADNARKEDIRRPLEAEREKLTTMVRELEQAQRLEAQNYERLKSLPTSPDGTPAAETDTQLADIEQRMRRMAQKETETAALLETFKQTAAALKQAG